MQLTTITQVTKQFGISTRTLRYYEKIGLIASQRTPDYAYRTYDGEALQRLRQILILRKLRIPLKEIAVILQTGGAVEALSIFTGNLDKLQDEITALSVIRSILQNLVIRLQAATGRRWDEGLLEDRDLMALVQSLSLSKIPLQEEYSMDELTRAGEKLSRLKSARIVYLPPCTVAASHCIGPQPEEAAEARLREFLAGSRLFSQKPDARVFGFNHPSPTEESPVYGYEFWVTVPEGMEAPAPMEIKQFPGGLYAAHTIAMGSFQEWDLLYSWARDNPDVEPANLDDGGACMGGLLEEHLNFVYNQAQGTPAGEYQLDLLLPIRYRKTEA